MGRLHSSIAKCPPVGRQEHSYAEYAVATSDLVITPRSNGQPVECSAVQSEPAETFQSIFMNGIVYSSNLQELTCDPTGTPSLGRGGCNKSRENPGIAKVGLTPPPHPPILALWWISRQKVRKFDSRQLTTKRVNQHILG